MTRTAWLKTSSHPCCAYDMHKYISAQEGVRTQRRQKIVNETMSLFTFISSSWGHSFVVNMDLTGKYIQENRDHFTAKLKYYDISFS